MIETISNSIEDEICMICGDPLGKEPRTQLTPRYWVHSECLRKKEKSLETLREQEQREDELERLRQAEKKKQENLQQLMDLTWDDY